MLSELDMSSKRTMSSSGSAAGAASERIQVRLSAAEVHDVLVPTSWSISAAALHISEELGLKPHSQVWVVEPLETEIARAAIETEQVEQLQHEIGELRKAVQHERDKLALMKLMRPELFSSQTAAEQLPQPKRPRVD